MFEEEETIRLREPEKPNICEPEKDLMEFNLSGRASTLDKQDSLDDKVIIENLPMGRKMISSVGIFVVIVTMAALFYVKKIAPVPGSLLSFKN